MTGRTPACEDSAAIGERLREIQRERMARIAGCECPPDGQGGTTHRPGCPLEPRPAAMPSQMDAAREAIQRRGLHAYRTRGMPEPERHNTSISPMNTAVDAAERYVEEIERAIADKAVRLWVPS